MDHRYRYVAPSACALSEARAAVDLATSGGREPNPFLFSGLLPHPRQTARGLLTVAGVARKRFYEPMTAQRLEAMLDPVITVHDDLLRFEAFSSCCSVYVRLDQPVSNGVAAWGTTNIDVNPPMRAALASVGDRSEMLLSVGSDQVTLTTESGGAVERKVPLPERWLKGFVEVQLNLAGMLPAIRLGGTAARALLQQLPTAKTRQPFYVTPSSAGVRLSMRATPGAIYVDAPFRLRPLIDLLPHLESITVHALPPDDADMPTASAWSVQLRDAHLLLVLSPELSRGFSGEGGVLVHAALSDPTAAATIGRQLQGQRRLQPEDLGRRLDLDNDSVASGLAQLGMLGRLGYDVVDEAYFHRDLPFDRSRLEKLQPRLVDARTLVQSGAVSLRAEHEADVRSGEATYRVRAADGAWRCTCRWYAKHAGTRGPCKHVLAVQLTRDCAFVLGN